MEHWKRVAEAANYYTFDRHRLLSLELFLARTYVLRSRRVRACRAKDYARSD